MEDDTTQQSETVNPSVEPSAPEAHRPTRRERQKRRKLIALICAGVALILISLGGLYWFAIRDTDKNKSVRKPSGQQGQNQNQQGSTPIDPTPVKYKSTKLNIELTHRKDWTLKEADDGEITVTAPEFSYTRVDGESTNGVFTVKIRKGVPEAMEATIEKAVAPRASEVIAYAEPTKEQREYTNLSYAGQKDIFNFFIVTGNAAFKAGGGFAYGLPLDGQFYLIVGGYGQDKDGTLSFDSVPKESMDSTTLEQAVDIVESLKIY